MKFENTTLPSGVMLNVQYDDNGDVVKEQFSVGMLEIGIARDYSDGKVVNELYFWKRKMVSRKKYSKEVVNYKDLPQANPELDDFSGMLAKGARDELRQAKLDSKIQEDNPLMKEENDKFCVDRISESKNINELQEYSVLLGERIATVSIKIIRKMLKCNPKGIFIGKLNIDDEEKLVSAGTLIVELPDSHDSRIELMKIFMKLGNEIGYSDAIKECGQKYIFTMLD